MLKFAAARTAWSRSPDVNLQWTLVGSMVLSEDPYLLFFFIWQGQ